jgi:hypothetical protein
MPSQSSVVPAFPLTPLPVEDSIAACTALVVSLYTSTVLGGHHAGNVAGSLNHLHVL